MENWKPIEGYEGLYEVSDCGRVRRNKVLNPDNSSGYLRIMLHAGKKQRRVGVHVLVAHAFLGPCPEGMERNHKDGDKTNNRVDNLEYVTRSENQHHSYDVLGKQRMTGSTHGMHKLVEDDVLNIRRIAATSEMTLTAIAAKFDVSVPTISMIVNRKTWRHV